MRNRLNELKTKQNGDSLDIVMKNAKFASNLTHFEDSIILTFESTKPYVTYKGKLDEKTFAKYKKEILALYKDFDEIFAEINKKFKLN